MAAPDEPTEVRPGAAGPDTDPPSSDPRASADGGTTAPPDASAGSRANLALTAESEHERYRGLFEHAPDAVYLALPDGTILDANPAACRLHGMTLEELRRSSRAGLVVQDESHAAALRDRARTGQAEAEMRVRRKDGTTVPVEVRSILLDPARPEESEAVIISRDLRAHQRAEQALRDSQRFNRSLVESSRDCIKTLDLDGNLLSMSDAGQRLLGIADLGPLLHRSWVDFWRLEDRDRVLQAIAAARGDGVGRFQAFCPSASAEPRWWDVMITPLHDERGAVERLLAVSREITEQKLAELALREAVAGHERQVRLFDGVTSTTPDFVYVFDRQGRFVYANRRLLEVWGMQLPDVVGKTCRELGYEQWHHDMHMREIAQVIETRRPIKGEVPFKAPLTGIFGVYEYIFTPVLGPDGEVESVAGTTRDVTERHRAAEALRAANEQLREADRRKDEFLGMLSHELRNPLAPIRNSVYVLRHADPASPQAARAQAVIERQTEHLARLVDDLLDVTRVARGKIQLRRARIELREVVARAAEDFRLVLQERGVAFQVLLPDARLWADADATRVTQVVGNLLHNASKFTRRGDAVTLSLSSAQGVAELRVRDTGAGIDAALLPTLFEPFVQGERTLARTQGGLGLGLALVKGIAELHGGSVGAESAGAGRGAEFLVRIPVEDQHRGDEPRE